MGIVLKLMRILLGWGSEMELKFVANFAAGGIWV